MTRNLVAFIGFLFYTLLSFTAVQAESQSLTINGTVYSFTYCKTPVTNWTLCWTYNSTDITIALSFASASAGWIGFSFSPSGLMPNSSSVVGWQSDNGNNTFVDNFHLDPVDRVQPTPGSTILEIKSMAVERQANANTTIVFTRPLSLANSYYNIDPNQPTKFILAGGALPDSVETGLTYHYDNRHSNNQVTFATASISSINGASSSTGASAAASTATGKTLIIAGQSFAFSQCANYELQFEICWNLLESSVQIAVSVVHNGWIGLGFSLSGNMLGSSAIIGWCSSDGSNKKVDNYELTSLTSYNTVSNRELKPTNMVVDYNTATQSTIMLFSRPLQTNNSYSISPSNNVNVIYAKGDLPASSTDLPAYHGINNRVAGATINFSTGQVSEGSDSKVLYRKVHAALMAIAWGFFLPLGILIGAAFRGYGPIWFTLHRLLNTTGLMLALAGWILASLQLQATHLEHKKLGIAVMSLALFQFVNALFRPQPPKSGEKPSLLRLVWAQCHKNLGRIAFVMAIVNCLIGFAILNPPQRYFIVFNVFWCAIVALGIVLQIRQCFTSKPPFTQCFGEPKAEETMTERRVGLDEQAIRMQWQN